MRYRVESEQVIIDPAERVIRLRRLRELLTKATDRGEFGDLTRPVADSQTEAARPEQHTMSTVAGQKSGG